jgi:hypothetical protein
VIPVDDFKIDITITTTADISYIQKLADEFVHMIQNDKDEFENEDIDYYYDVTVYEKSK